MHLEKSVLKKISDIRNKMKLSHVDMAKALNISTRSYYLIENGIRVSIPPDTVIQIAKVLKIDFCKLLDNNKFIIQESRNKNTLNVCDFRKYITRLRENRGWTKQDVATKSNLKRQHISKIELGQIKNTDIEVLKSIAKVFGLNFEDFTKGAKFYSQVEKNQKKLLHFENVVTNRNPSK